ncbi:MAG: hypothetical protein NVS4B13_07640 [Candidatus Elarobacter sp.]
MKTLRSLVVLSLIGSVAGAFAACPAGADQQTPPPKTVEPHSSKASQGSPVVKSPKHDWVKHTNCGADPAAISITFARNAAPNTVNVIGTIRNVGDAPQAGSRVRGHQFAYLYAVGMSAFPEPNQPIATAVVPPLGVGEDFTIRRTLDYPFTEGDVPTQLRLMFMGEPDVGIHPEVFNCNTANDNLLITVDKKPLYPYGADSYRR